MSLRPPTAATAEKLLSLFQRAQFEPQGIAEVLGSNEATSKRRRNQALLLHRTEEHTTLNTLLRLFLVGADVEKQRADATLAPAEIDDLLRCGLVEESDEGFRSPVMLSPYEGFFLAADRLTELESGENPEAVLMVNRTTWRLGQFMLREPVESTLDLGAGCGALSLVASRHSKQVVATDLNPRAVHFSQFNVALNRVDNVECVTGDAWQPVAGRRFSRIVSNPPFFLSPNSRSLFSDNPFDLDEFCRRLVREAGRYLEPDGVYQMVFEWAEVDGEPWAERLREWVDGIGCDAWIAKGYSVPSDRYAHQRITEKAISDEDLEATFELWRQYFSDRRVVSIHGGVLALKRRRGPNWIQLAELPGGTGDSGQALRDRFNSLDYVHLSDSVLETRPRLSPGAQLSQQLQLDDGDWKVVRMQLELVDGLPDKLSLDPSVLGLLTALDGSQTVREIAAKVAEKANREPAQTAEECVQLIQTLAGRGFVTGS